MTDWHIPSHADKPLTVDPALWVGVRNAIIPSLLFWAAFAALGWVLASL